ncbi:OmpA family protein [uncultured Tateyamaria sp.]|uniref:OmpA family protein n=1 Tax=uncultured Tateyamaria sp. TaxID=455651 RepID=UPI00261307DC|nr:OmpA family protein [uncultured Tateyamaria sp.]
MVRKGKERDVRALRAAGLTLASADRVAQSGGGSSVKLIGVAAVSILVLAGIGVYSLNLSGTRAQVATPLDSVQVAQAEVMVEAAKPAPAETAQAVEVEQENIGTTPAAPTDLPWVTALNNAASQPASPATELQDIAMSVPVTARPAQPARLADCVDTLAAQVAKTVLNFDAGSAEIRPDDLITLARVGAQINNCPAARVQIAGHSDTSGTDLINLQLSWTRAENTLNALASLDVDVSQFEAVGFGSRAPLTEGSDAEDAINRRVELRVMRKEVSR